MSNMVYKKDLTTDEKMMVRDEFEKKAKSPGVAYALWFFLGAFGGHRFYAGNIGYAIGMLFTLGGLGFWALVDVFFIGKAIERKNEEIEREIIDLFKRTNIDEKRQDETKIDNV